MDRFRLIRVSSGYLIVAGTWDERRVREGGIAYLNSLSILYEVVKKTRER
jgi:hypothetical protein